MIRTFSRELSLNCFVTLYKALVRPILEYGVPVWNNTSNAEEAAIEQIQRVFVRTVYRRHYGEGTFYSYEYISRKLELPALAARRSALDASFVIKALTGEVDNPGATSNLSILPMERRRQRIFGISSSETILVSVRVGRLLNALCSDADNLNIIHGLVMRECVLSSIDLLTQFVVP